MYSGEKWSICEDEESEPCRLQDVLIGWMSQGGHSETVLVLALFDQSTPSWIKVIGWCGGGGGVVAHVILVSALGPNPSFFLFLGTFIQL